MAHTVKFLVTARIDPSSILDISKFPSIRFFISRKINQSSNLSFYGIQWSIKLRNFKIKNIIYGEKV